METVVFVGAHPDDETMLAGGTLTMLAQNGHQTHVICATRGEGGELGEPPVTDNRDEIGKIREQEVKNACAAMKVSSLTFLDYVDPFIGEDDELFPFEADYDTLVGQIREHLFRLGASVVIMHGSDGEYGHPAHILMHRATLEAVQGMEDVPIVYSIAANVPGVEDRLQNKNDLAHFALEIEPWVEGKLAGAEAHVSQHALFKRRKKLDNVRDALRMVESFRRFVPAAEDSPPTDRFADILLSAGAYRPEITTDD